jgi:hypothetical protein
MAVMTNVLTVWVGEIIWAEMYIRWKFDGLSRVGREIAEV